MSGAPRLTTRLTLEEAQSVPDGAGGFSEAWTPVGVLWAEVKARSGTGRPGAFRGTGKLGLKVTVRFAPQGSAARPKPGQRFTDQERNYAIEAVHERDGHRGYLTCFAEEERAI